MKPTYLLRYFLPLITFLILIAFLWRGLYLDPRKLPSALINKPAPAFALPTLINPKIIFTKNDLLGHWSLLHVWATWCLTCQEEQPFLMDLARDRSIPIYAIDYKDDANTAKQWLHDHGNPYQLIGFDVHGDTGINWGVYGTPETFLIDKNGEIRYKVTGALTPEIWQTKILPMIKNLS